MVSTEVWLVNLVGAGAWVAGGYLAINHVLPAAKALLADVVKYNKALNALIKLLTIWIWVVVAGGVIDKLVAIGEKAVGYVSVFTPALDLLNSLVPYVQWIVIGFGLIVIAERIKR